GIVRTERYESHYINETWYAVHTLAKIGPAARDAVPTLIRLLDRDSGNPHWFSNKTQYLPAGDNIFAYALGRVGPAAVPELLKVVRDASGPARRAAVAGAAARGAGGVPAVAAILHDGE